MNSPVISETPSGCCFTGFKHEGTPGGHEISLGGMQTYMSTPLKPTNKILFFFADIMGPFYVNNKLLQDYFASNGALSGLFVGTRRTQPTKGFTVLGPDYFFGDLLSDHTEPDFDRNAWIDNAIQRAREATPKWIEAVKETYGTFPGDKNSVAPPMNINESSGNAETKYVATGKRTLPLVPAQKCV